MLDEAVGGRGGLVLIGGEAGIGKTALATSIAYEAQRPGNPGVGRALLRVRRHTALRSLDGERDLRWAFRSRSASPDASLWCRGRSGGQPDRALRANAGVSDGNHEKASHSSHTRRPALVGPRQPGVVALRVPERGRARRAARGHLQGRRGHQATALLRAPPDPGARIRGAPHRAAPAGRRSGPRDGGRRLRPARGRRRAAGVLPDGPHGGKRFLYHRTAADAGRGDSSCTGKAKAGFSKTRAASGCRRCCDRS